MGVRCTFPITLPLSFEQESPSLDKYNETKWQNSLISNLPTPWSQSTSQKKDGTNSPELSPRPQDSHLLRPSHVQWISITSIVVCMLVMRILTLTLLISLTLSSANITVFPLDSNMSLRWTSKKSTVTSSQKFPLNQSESALDDPSKDLVCLPESPRTNVLVLRTSSRALAKSSQAILLANTTH